jgi:hypothetical protein
VTEEGDYEILLDHLLDAKQLNPTLQREYALLALIALPTLTTGH